jgi:hypothetical protein
VKVREKRHHGIILLGAVLMLTASEVRSAVAQEEQGTAAVIVAQEAAAATQANVSTQETGSSEPSRAGKGEVEAGFIGGNQAERDHRAVGRQDDGEIRCLE